MLCKIAMDNGVDLSQAEEAAVGLELVHLATLVHDDVIDDADLRRDRASLRGTRNDRAAILFGDYLFSLAIRQIQSTQNATCAGVFTRQVEDTCRGESIQDLLLTWEDSQPTLDLLTQAARGKTGALFSFCTQAPFAISEAPQPVRKDFTECGYLCGLGFQWADDLLDILGEQGDMGKPVGNDLTKNTMTTPLFLMMKDKGWNWATLREAYATSTKELREDFFESTSHRELEKMIEETRLKLFDLGESLETSGYSILETLNLFWDRYVKGRMSNARDARP